MHDIASSTLFLDQTCDFQMRSVLALVLLVQILEILVLIYYFLLSTIYLALGLQISDSVFMIRSQFWDL